MIDFALDAIYLALDRFSGKGPVTTPEGAETVLPPATAVAQAQPRGTP